MKEEPALTRRLINEEHETWAIMRDDIRVGTIGLRTGQPNGMPAWAWFCGFDPGCAPGQHRSGVADSFEEARASFQRAWEHLQTVMPADAYELQVLHGMGEAIAKRKVPKVRQPTQDIA